MLELTVDRIETINIGEINDDMQLLSENEYRYRIYVKYADDDLVGYHSEIHPENWYDRDSIAGYDAAEVIVSTFELDKYRFETEYSKLVIGGGGHTHSEMKKEASQKFSELMRSLR